MCHLPLFESTAKNENGTGWPSFFDAIPDRLGTVVASMGLQGRWMFDS